MPLPTYSRTVESMHSEISVTSNLVPQPQKILRLEIVDMIYDIKKCGDRIRQLRIQSGYTQESLAKKLDIDRSLLSHVEVGKRGCSVDLLVRLSDLFDVTLDLLVLGRAQIAQSDSFDKSLLKTDIIELVAHLEAFKEKL